MKKLAFMFVMAIMPIAFASCGGSDDEDGAGGNNSTPKAKVEISVSDEVVGERQIVELSVNYQTDNPNYLVTWYADGEKLNSIPKSELQYDWKAGEKGTHLIEVVITDREDVLKYEKSIEVVETELGDAIIGDNKSKIARTFGTSETNDVITYSQSSARTYKYYFTAENKLYKIYYEYAVSLSPRNRTDYMIPLTTFASGYKKYKEKFGEPIRENYTQLETSESKIVEYGGHIYSGSMYVQAVFQTSTRTAEVYVGPYKSGMGFTYSETLESR